MDICKVLAFGAIVYAIYRLIKWLSQSDGELNYSKTRPQIMRMEEIRADIDSIDEFLSDVDVIKRAKNVEVYAYIKYTPVAGNTEKSLRVPIALNADNFYVLAYEEKKRLKCELMKPMSKVKKILEKV